MKEMGLRRALIAYLFLALFSHLSIAQEAGEHRPSRIIIHAAKLLEVRTGKTLADQAIVIDGDKIVSVGPMVQVQRSTSDRLIDLPNATVLPGLTDAHSPQYWISITGNLHPTRDAYRCSQCAAHAGSWVHHGPQRRR